MHFNTYRVLRGVLRRRKTDFAFPVHQRKINLSPGSTNAKSFCVQGPLTQNHFALDFLLIKPPIHSMTEYQGLKLSTISPYTKVFNLPDFQTFSLKWCQPQDWIHLTHWPLKLLGRLLDCQCCLRLLTGNMGCFVKMINYAEKGHFSYILRLF